MVRRRSIEKYETEVRLGLSELFNLCRKNMSHSGDLLLCQQNGFLFNDDPCVGPGEEGLNNLQNLNSISIKGVGEIVEDNKFFIEKKNTIFNGTTSFEKCLHQQKYTYLNIWENAYFLRTITQLVNVLNGNNYDWKLVISDLPPSGKSKHIRKQIERLVPSPNFQRIVKEAYVGQIRNAIAHSQYHLVQGGILYNNYGKDKYSTLQGLTFDEWERKYLYTYFILIGIFQILKQILNELYVPISKRTFSKGIPIKVPDKSNGFYEVCIYPNETGDTWRFVKV